MRKTPALTGALTVLLLLVIPATAMGQATRTWVSSAGNDANPCSRSAPCQTLATAHNNTAAGGEINVVDAGGFGGVTITKAITIRNEGGYTAGVLVAGTNAIVINAGPTDSVTLDGLDINGLGTGAPSSLTGVKVLSAGKVRVENSHIYRFRAGIVFAPTSADTRLIVNNTTIYDNGVGIISSPRTAPASTGAGDVLVENSRVEGNTCGVVVTDRGTNASTPNAAIDCGAAASGTAVSARLSIFSSSISQNSGRGLVADGGSARATIGDDIIAGNGIGLQTLNGGVINSLGSNAIYDNGTDGAPTQENSTLGRVGPAGPAGPAGPSGAAGAPGAAGAKGADGKVQVVTCRRVSVRVRGKRRRRNRCTTRLVTTAVKFTTSTNPTKARVTLSRAGRVVARGTARLTHRRAAVSVRAGKTLRGRYTLRLIKHGRVIATRTVRVR